MKALVIDDARAIRLLLSKILTELGLDVIQASDGRQAVAVMESENGGSVRLILVDWNMPEMSGLEFVQWLRARPVFKDVRVMMVTTETEVEQMVRALEAGADEYAMKPFTRAVVQDKLRILGVLE